MNRARLKRISPGGEPGDSCFTKSGALRLAQPACSALLGLAMAAAVQAQVLPNNATVDGKTIGEWSAEWLTWLYSIPINQNPVFDPDGRWATNSQPRGSVFFLYGILESTGSVVRRFSVAEGKFLFLSLFNVNVENIDTEPPLTVEELRDFAAQFVALPLNMHAVVDGVAINNLLDHRAASPVFSLNFPSPDNLKTFQYGHPITGLIDPVVADGYWLMIEPLAPGRHVVNYGATTAPPVIFSQDITEIITIVPVPLDDRVAELTALLDNSELADRHQEPLRVSLNAAKASFSATNLLAGINQLRAFQNKLRAQVARTDPVLADQFSQGAQRIIDKATSQLDRP